MTTYTDGVMSIVKHLKEMNQKQIDLLNIVGDNISILKQDVSKVQAENEELTEKLEQYKPDPRCDTSCMFVCAGNAKNLKDRLSQEIRKKEILTLQNIMYKQALEDIQNIVLDHQANARKLVMHTAKTTLSRAQEISLKRNVKYEESVEEFDGVYPKINVQNGEQETASLDWPTPIDIIKNKNNPLFNAIWEAIKTWNISVPSAYSGHMKATGNHVVAIMQGIKSTVGGNVVFNMIENCEKQCTWLTPAELARGNLKKDKS